MVILKMMMVMLMMIDDFDDDDPLECAQRVFCDAGIVSKVKP